MSMSVLPGDLGMDLLCWGNGELGQTGCGRTEDIGPEQAHLGMFTAARQGRVKLLACGSSHSIVVTGTVLVVLYYTLLKYSINYDYSFVRLTFVLGEFTCFVISPVSINFYCLH